MLGIGVWFLSVHYFVELSLRITIGGVAFFAVYLASTAVFALGLTAEHMRKSASNEDEAIGVIILILLASICVSLAAIFSLLNGDGQRNALHLTLLLPSVPLGWLTLHTVLAFHYAHLFYAPAGRRKNAGGLEFPGTKEPTTWDFLYFSFTVGMTAQVSDVQVSDPAQRRLVLWHGIVSFFYNTGILALAVNVAVQSAS